MDNVGQQSSESPDSLDSALRNLTNLPDLGAVLRTLRRRQARRSGRSPLTYRDIATATGWSRGIVGEYLNGHVLPPTDRFDVLVQLLGATRTELPKLADGRDRIEDAGRQQPAGRPHPVIPIARQLPPDPPGFVGREAQLQHCRQVIAAGTGSIAILITGPAGIGKSAFGLHLAHWAAPAFPDGQLFINLRGFDPGQRPMTAAAALRKLLQSLGVDHAGMPAGVSARSTLLRRQIEGRRLLFLLDNAVDADQIRPLLPDGGRHLVLMTSRNQLPTLVVHQGAHPIVLPSMTSAESRTMLVQRLFRESDHENPEDATALDRLVDAAGGIPLATAVIGARALLNPTFSLPELAAELTGTESILAIGTTDPAIDLAEVFSWSYRGLTAGAAMLFRALSNHPGSDFGRDLVTAVSQSGSTGWLTELVESNLLVERLPGRFGFHDLLRAYATSLSQQLDSADTRIGYLVRAAEHYVTFGIPAAMALAPNRTPLSGETGKELSPMDRAAALSWFEMELTNILAVVAAAEQHGINRSVWRLCWLLPHYLDWIGDRDGWIETQTRGVEAARRMSDPHAEATSLLFLGNAYFFSGDGQRAARLHRRSLSLFEELGDIAEQARLCSSLNTSAGQTESLDVGIGYAARAVELWRDIGDTLGVARGLNGLAWSFCLIGRADAAIPPAQEAVALFNRLQDPLNESQAWDTLGYAHLQLREWDRAIECFHRAVDIYSLSPIHLAQTLDHLAQAHAGSSDADAARGVWQQALSALNLLSTPEAAETADAIGASMRQAGF